MQKKAAQGFTLSLVLIAIFFVFNRDVVTGEIFFLTTLPNYQMSPQRETLFEWFTLDEILYRSELQAENIQEEAVQVSATQTPAEIIGLFNVTYQPESDNSNIEEHRNIRNFTIYDLEEFRDINTLMRHFYIIDPRTIVTPRDTDLFDVERFINTDLRLSENVDGPQVLIFHVHAFEEFIDSDISNIYDGIVGVGAYLAETLQRRHGINAMHDYTRFDLVDGRVQLLGAYERAEIGIRRILEENPTIEVVIDLHRDGVPEHIRLVSDINGRPTAQIMFVNGLSRQNDNGVPRPIAHLYNPYLNTNLAFSFQMQLMANEMFPGITRRVYLNAFRYSLHMMPKSLLIELGAQTNTRQEALNAVEPLSDILAQILLG